MMPHGSSSVGKSVYRLKNVQLEEDRVFVYLTNPNDIHILIKHLDIQTREAGNG